jgi:glutathione synthase
MPVKLGVVMDPISEITVKKDSTLAMLLAAQARGWSLEYMELKDLYLSDGICHGRMRPVTVRDDQEDWFDLGDAETRPLSELDVVLMRKDPPFDMEFIYATYLLERAEQLGVLVINKPQSLRDANEKMYTAWFPQCCPPTLVTREMSRLYEFLSVEKTIIVKPLDGMGGASIFRATEGDANTNVIFETMTRHEQRFIMAQRFLPEIRDGDKRVLLINGEPVPYALARVPAGSPPRWARWSGTRVCSSSASTSSATISRRSTSPAPPVFASWMPSTGSTSAGSSWTPSKWHWRHDGFDDVLVFGPGGTPGRLATIIQGVFSLGSV